jgi:large subunit ribosomal protein L31
MKSGIHPVYKIVTVTCACGETFTTRSTRDDMRLEICAKCHPFFTGKQKLIDSAGRVERFQKRYKNVPKEGAPSGAKATSPAVPKTAIPAGEKAAAKRKTSAAAGEGKGTAAGG